MPAGGGIIQIAAQGRQNEVINAEPNFTLFKTSHNKYTNFSEDFEWQDFNGVVSFGAQKAPTTISRYGDLITDVHLWVSLPPIRPPADGLWNQKTPADPTATPPVAATYYKAAAYWVNAIGYALMEEVSLEIGSQDIDTLYSDYLFLWEELTQRPGARVRESVGRFEWTEGIETEMIEFASKQRDLFVQIPFFFNKYFLEKGLALPLISLTYHEIKIKISFAKIEDIACVVVQDHVLHPGYLAAAEQQGRWLLIENGVGYAGLPGASAVPINDKTGAALQPTELVAKLLVTYIYLDINERTSFTTSGHEMLITILQRQLNSVATPGLTQDSLKLYFNHPSNFVLWVIRPRNYKTNAGRRRYSVGHKDMFDYSKKIDTPNTDWGLVEDAITNTTLKLNSHERWPENMPAHFFRVMQPQLKFENIPQSFLYVFCFSIAGGVWNPTSTLNFSRIEHTQLDLKYAANIEPSEIIIFVESYNLLVIQNGMGGLKFSN